eukprot:8901054-Ditylum_brightwellii.AAC.1
MPFLHASTFNSHNQKRQKISVMQSQRHFTLVFKPSQFRSASHQSKTLKVSDVTPSGPRDFSFAISLMALQTSSYMGGLLSSVNSVQGRTKGSACFVWLDSDGLGDGHSCR